MVDKYIRLQYAEGILHRLLTLPDRKSEFSPEASYWKPEDFEKKALPDGRSVLVLKPGVRERWLAEMAVRQADELFAAVGITE